MITTSAAYKTAIAQDVVNWQGKASIDYTDYNIDNSITPIVNDSDRLSDNLQLADGIESPTYKWWSWNNFEWGQHLRAEEPTENEKGALSNRLSDNDDTFKRRIPGFFNSTFFGGTLFSDYVNYPSFAVTFSERAVDSIKVVFDDLLFEWATDFDVNIYVGSTLSHTEVVTGNTTVNYFKQLSSEILLVTMVEVVVKTWNIPDSKAKIMEMFTSIQIDYTGNDILEFGIQEEGEPEKATIPIGNITANSCHLKLLNIDNEFDNDNESSILFGNITKNRRIKLFLNPEETDDIPLGTFYATNWKIDNNLMIAEVLGQDIINLMGEQSYTKSQFITPASTQSIIYTTTGDFTAFTRDNVDATNNELIFAGAAIVCDTINIGSFFGSTFFGSSYFEGSLYCGTAEKQISFNYTPGTTISTTISSYTYNIPIGCHIRWFYSYKLVEDFTEFNPSTGFVYTPEDVNDTTQIVTIKILFESNSTTTKPSIQNFTFNVDEKVTLFSLASLVIEDFDDETNLIEGNYEIAQEFGQCEIPNAYLLPQTHRSALKQICEAGGGRAYSSRLGVLKVEVLKTIGDIDKTYTNDEIFQIVQPVNDNELFNRVTVTTNPLEENAVAEQVASTKIEIGDTEVQTITVKFNKKPVGSITLSGLPGGVTATDEIYYTWGGTIELTNASGSTQSFTLVINGKVYEITGSRQFSYDDSESIRKNGIIEYLIDNPLIQTEEQAQDVGSSMINSFKEQRRETQMNALIDPAVEIGDTLSINDNYYIVNSETIDLLPGQVSQNIGGKK